MDLYGALVRHVLYPAWEKGVRRRPILARLERLRELERASLDELEAHQARELAALVAHAYENVPYYREAMRGRDLAPADVRSAADLPRLPLLTRQAARASVESRVSLAGPPPVIVKTTGGTTGEPLVIRYDLDSEYWRQAIRLRGFGWAGYRIGDPSLHYWGAPTKPGTPLSTRLKIAVDRGLKREHYVDCTPRGDDHKEAVVELIRAVEPRAIMCYAQAGADLARFINRRGLRRWKTIPVLCGAEKIFPDDRAALEEAFGKAVFETYGCREFMLMATECSAHDGLHISMENLIVELVNDEGEPVAPGEVGQVAVTDLHNYGSPLVRYLNGDLAVAAAGRCPCGRAHPRLQSIEGRRAETLSDAAGRPVGGMVFNLLFSPLADEVEQFQAVQHGDRSITVRVVARGPLSPRVREHIDSQTRKYLGELPVRVLEVESIPLTKSGKRRVVIVEEATG